jgi:hypothetical protein
MKNLTSIDLNFKLIFIYLIFSFNAISDSAKNIVRKSIDHIKIKKVTFWIKL